ncbi:MAG: hypothetical protein K1563_06155 [Candidatus Thiodiazotropha sp. (ex. Lucinisca nassula)]|uniref:hypothetical protein n=1 Tax=Candidatus Thiodiazotropha sp. LNASS1 TaxID=3096260 RepID=UPI001D65E2CB|nr:hypothetical protein [Candidatus Thiodiazotropha sp. (ex. Lucinisca nassula)]MBW9273255.1 hypothetical protein [Candidatus Thiodiazotropha sp. (ex. Lucinisca nassula)]
MKKFLICHHAQDRRIVMNILRYTLIFSVVCLFAGCSSEENNSKKTKGDAGVFQGYRDVMDKAENVEQTLIQANKERREEIDRQQ